MARPAREIRQVLKLVESDLLRVESQIANQAKAFDPSVEGYVSYACASNGKRLRPALALLSGGATGGITKSHVDLAVIVEMIHLATLVHDDIMDGADIRRDQPTANAKWGNSISVLLGDCLFAHALKLSTSFDDAEISRRIAFAATEVCSGEIIQTQRRFDLNLSLADYFKIIEMKTAALFAVSAELGARLNKADDATVAKLQSYGRKLGTAYQIYDDCLDLAGNEGDAGKTLGTDLRKGKFTLPVLTFLHNQRNGHHEEIRRILLEGDDDDFSKLGEQVREEGALNHSVNVARKIIVEAEDELLSIEESEHRNALIEVTHCVQSVLDQFED